MKKTSLVLLLATAGSLSAANLMLDFGSSESVADPYLTLSPAHDDGAIPGGDTSWNVLATSADRSDLVYSDGAAATGVTLNLGQESTSGSGVVSFSTEVTNLGLAGSGGGVPGQQSFLGAGSIYGDDGGSTAAGRDGIFGSGSGTEGSALGVRLDGLTPGLYTVYIMGRNTNSNAESVPMNLFASSGLASGSFDFSTLAAMTQSNPGYESATYAGEYTNFVEGENFVSTDVVVGDGESLYLVSDGGSEVETRGFLNMVQIVPEPSTALLSLTAGLLLFRRRR